MIIECNVWIVIILLTIALGVLILAVSVPIIFWLHSKTKRG